MQFSILFSPSEDKVIKDDEVIKKDSIPNEKMPLQFLESLWGQKLTFHRKQIIEKYHEVLREILESHDKSLLESIHGAKNFNDKNLFELHSAMSFTSLLPAIERYIGVAFQGLEFSSLPKEAKDYILQNVLIFSNLFGVVRAKDSLPFYKLKQGTKLSGLSLKEVYEPFIPILHEYFRQSEYIIDLRAGIYTKLFMPNLPHFFFDFLKDGKIISHYAKLYRGKILRILAKEQCNLSKNECFEYLCDISCKDMKFHSYTKKNNRFHLIYECLIK